MTGFKGTTDLPMRLAHLIVLLMAAVVLTLASGHTRAQTLRWASQGDAQTMDPYSQNEGLTNSINQQVYEYLVARDKQLGFVPGLATEWKQVGPMKWVMTLRKGVKFHDGRPLTVDDVIFSINRAKLPTSQIAAYANAVGDVKKVGDNTIEFTQSQVDPVFLDHVSLLYIMSKTWCEENKVTKPQDFKNKEESFAAMNANGTGPYILVSRQPGIKTVWKRNPNWWGKPDGNVQDVVFTPIANDATRLAALISGELDFVLDPAPRDLSRLRNTAGIKVIDGMEHRIVFIGMDQSRDKLLYGNVPGDKNPFKDLRVRKALYEAVDIEAIKTKLMSGLALPTGGLTPSPKGAFGDAQLETRPPFDVAGARKLMADAGYADGFEVTLDCPNNRYINDEEICLSLAAMWSQLKVKVKVNAMPRVTYFAKLDKLDTSMYLLGWGGASTDPEAMLTSVMRNRGEKGVGYYNYGGSKNDKFDELAAASAKEPDPKKREEIVRQALREFSAQVNLIPLHRQVISWAARQNVNVVHRPDNYLEFNWITINK